MARLVLLVLSTLVCLASTAQASIVTWRFSGFVESSLLDDVPVGTAMTFDVRLDTSAPDSCREDGSGFFSSPGSDMHVGAHRYTSEWTAFEVNNPYGNCIAMPGASTVRLLLFDGGGFTAASIGFPFYADGDALPSAPPIGASTYFFMGRHGFSADVSGTLTYGTVPEPLPLTVSVASAVLPLLRRRWRRHRDVLAWLDDASRDARRKDEIG